MSTIHSPSASRATPLLLACGVAGPLLFLGLALVQGATRPGYSAWRNAVSQLALGDQGWVQTLSFFASGLLLLAFAVGLRRRLRPGSGSTWAPRLTGGVGLCLALLGLFPVNPGLGYPPGAPATYRPQGAVHLLLVTLMFGQLTALGFVLARRFALDTGGRRWASVSAAAGLVSAAFYVATVVAGAADQAGTGPAAWDGLIQRIALVAGFGWLSLVAGRLLRPAMAAPVTPQGPAAPTPAPAARARGTGRPPS
jgi:hypothetical protein